MAQTVWASLTRRRPNDLGKGSQKTMQWVCAWCCHVGPGSGRGVTNWMSERNLVSPEMPRAAWAAEGRALAIIDQSLSSARTSQSRCKKSPTIKRALLSEIWLKIVGLSNIASRVCWCLPRDVVILALKCLVCLRWVRTWWTPDTSWEMQTISDN